MFFFPCKQYALNSEGTGYSSLNLVFRCVTDWSVKATSFISFMCGEAYQKVILNLKMKKIKKIFNTNNRNNVIVSEISRSLSERSLSWPSLSVCWLHVLFLDAPLLFFHRRHLPSPVITRWPLLSEISSWGSTQSFSLHPCHIWAILSGNWKYLFICFQT